MITALRPGADIEHRYIRVATTATSRGELDLIAIERAVNGDAPAHLTRAEQTAAARILARRGVGVTEIGRRLGLTTSAVNQLLGITPAPRRRTTPRTRTQPGMEAAA